MCCKIVRKIIHLYLRIIQNFTINVSILYFTNDACVYEVLLTLHKEQWNFNNYSIVSHSAILLYK